MAERILGIASATGWYSIHQTGAGRSHVPVAVWGLIGGPADAPEETRVVGLVPAANRRGHSVVNDAPDFVGFTTSSAPAAAMAAPAAAAPGLIRRALARMRGES